MPTFRAAPTRSGRTITIKGSLTSEHGRSRMSQKRWILAGQLDQQYHRHVPTVSHLDDPDAADLQLARDGPGGREATKPSRARSVRRPDRPGAMIEDRSTRSDRLGARRGGDQNRPVDDTVTCVQRLHGQARDESAAGKVMVRRALEGASSRSATSISRRGLRRLHGQSQGQARNGGRNFRSSAVLNKAVENRFAPVERDAGALVVDADRDRLRRGRGELDRPHGSEKLIALSMILSMARANRSARPSPSC